MYLCSVMTPGATLLGKKPLESYFSLGDTYVCDLHSEIENSSANELLLNWTCPEIQPDCWKKRDKKRGFLPKKDEIKWLFFDVGSTLVDESRVLDNRMKKKLNYLV